MALTNIPDGHHVVRHCKRRHAVRDADGNFAGVHPDFFYLREDESYLSAFYYEFHAGNHDARMDCCVLALPFGTKTKEAMVRLDATVIRQTGGELDYKLRVVHDDKSAIPSKARITGLPAKPDERLGAELAANAIVDWKTL